MINNPTIAFATVCVGENVHKYSTKAVWRGWLDYFLNICLFTTMNICLIAKIGQSWFKLFAKYKPWTNDQFAFFN